ncbi:BON domain-containing protein [Granulicella rosea]|uniref:BON domain-containing protein n=1 Tax=Granulicella rosea TaxID=474952 RepID=A0A239L0W7_9BACT|nr:BON domain-containing protein [Granulicella rosea]SNT24227.1 BON domain-containing protein [Granulicella rosea]
MSDFKFPLAPQAVLSAALLLSLPLAGCKAKPAVDDATLSSQLQTRIADDQAVAGQPIQASVVAGVATLSGSVSNDAQRELVVRDATSVNGVKQVVNNLTVQAVPVPAGAPAPSVTETAPPPAPVAVIPVAPKKQIVVEPKPLPHKPAPIERAQNNIPEPLPPPPLPPMPVEKPAPPPPPKPEFRNVTLTAGSVLPIRITQTLDSATTQQGDSFTGAVATDIIVDGVVAIPQGTTVTGHVDAVQEAAHFKGSSLLTVSLTTLNKKGERVPLAVEPYSVKGKGRGESTAIKTGIGAGAGAILGGIFGGGKGAAIGAAAGGGVGAGSSAVTRGQQVQIPSESLVRFNLTSPISLRVPAGAPRANDEGLHQH